MPTYSEEYLRGYRDGHRSGWDDAVRTTRRDIGSDLGMAPKTKKKRKASAYSKRYGAAFRRLKKKHPRMAFSALSKKAHKDARRK